MSHALAIICKHFSDVKRPPTVCDVTSSSERMQNILMKVRGGAQVCFVSAADAFIAMSRSEALRVF